MKYCINCRHELPNRASFCSACGAEQNHLDLPNEPTAKQGSVVYGPAKIQDVRQETQGSSKSVLGNQTGLKASSVSGKKNVLILTGIAVIIFIILTVSGFFDSPQQKLDKKTYRALSKFEFKDNAGLHDVAFIRRENSLNYWPVADFYLLRNGTRWVDEEQVQISMITKFTPVVSGISHIRFSTVYNFKTKQSTFNSQEAVLGDGSARKLSASGPQNISSGSALDIVIQAFAEGYEQNGRGNN